MPHAVVSGDGIDVCMRCPLGCSECNFYDQVKRFNCTQCVKDRVVPGDTSTPLLYSLFPNKIYGGVMDCVDYVCGSGNMKSNKECDPNRLPGNAQNCDSVLCLKIDDSTECQTSQGLT